VPRLRSAAGGGDGATETMAPTATLPLAARDLAGGFKIPRSQPKRNSRLDVACFDHALLERGHTRRHPGG